MGKDHMGKGLTEAERAIREAQEAAEASNPLMSKIDVQYRASPVSVEIETDNFRLTAFPSEYQLVMRLPAGFAFDVEAFCSLIDPLVDAEGDFLRDPLEQFSDQVALLIQLRHVVAVVESSGMIAEMKKVDDKFGSLSAHFEAMRKPKRQVGNKV